MAAGFFNVYLHSTWSKRKDNMLLRARSFGILFSLIRIYSGIYSDIFFCSWEQNSRNGNPSIPE